MLLLSAIVRGALAELEAMILTLSSRSKRLATSGCCLVCSLVTDTHILTANVGDCRALLVYSNGDKVSYSPLSIDHSVKTNSFEVDRVFSSLDAVDKMPIRPGYS
jgi:serine/threonine protein phosphatase PrpC